MGTVHQSGHIPDTFSPAMESGFKRTQQIVGDTKGKGIVSLFTWLIDFADQNNCFVIGTITLNAYLGTVDGKKLSLV